MSMASRTPRDIFPRAVAAMFPIVATGVPIISPTAVAIISIRCGILLELTLELLATIAAKGAHFPHTGFRLGVSTTRIVIKIVPIVVTGPGTSFLIGGVEGRSTPIVSIVFHITAIVSTVIGTLVAMTVDVAIGIGSL
jgi:hypothetical protein